MKTELSQRCCALKSCIGAARLRAWPIEWHSPVCCLLCVSFGYPVWMSKLALFVGGSNGSVSFERWRFFFRCFLLGCLVGAALFISCLLVGRMA